MSLRSASRPYVLLSAATLLAVSGCSGGGGEQEAAPAAPPPSPAAAADPGAEWINAVTGACTTLAGAVSGKQLQSGADGRLTPAEILAVEREGRPAVDAFDAALAALPAPPEAAEAEKALQTLLAVHAPTVPALLQAAEAGDQKAINATLAEREKLRLGPQGLAALTAAGLPGTCYFRTTYR